MKGITAEDNFHASDVGTQYFKPINHSVNFPAKCFDSTNVRTGISTKDSSMSSKTKRV